MNPWAVVVGHSRTGKEDALREVVAGLSAAGRRVAGFIQVRLVREDRVYAYDVEDTAGERRLRIAEAGKDPEVCDYGFVPEAFQQARKWTLGEDAEVVLVEVGKLEAGGQGHWPTFEAALNGPPRVVIAAIRPDLLASFVLRLADPFAALETPANPDDVQRFVKTIAERTTALAG